MIKFIIKLKSIRLLTISLWGMLKLRISFLVRNIFKK
jgi:hypothetical protein